MTVSDDGRGMEPGDSEEGAGLAGMRERVEALGGAVELTEPARGGTRLEVRLPLRTEKAE